MEKYGWWQVCFKCTLDGEEIYFDKLSDATIEHICRCIKDGCYCGEIVESDVNE